MATEDLTTQAGWDAFAARHGGVVGQPNKVSADRDESGRRVEHPFYHYELGDGSTVEINGVGEVKSLDEKPPRNPPNTTITDPRTGEPIAVTTPSGAAVTLPRPSTTTETIEIGGVKYQRDPSAPGGWRKIDAPGNVPTPTPNSQKPPSDPSKWVEIKAPDGRVIAMQDPVTGERVVVPASPTDKNPAAGTVKDTFEGGRTITWTADGNGNWTIKTIGQALQDPNKPKEGDTRPNVSGGYEIREVYRGGQWVTDPGFTPKPYDPNLATKPKEGDTRPNVAQGQQIQEIYRGGQWVVDPSVPPKPYGPQTPTTVNTGTAPYIVQQTPGQPGFQISDNPNTTDVAARVQQLQQQAQAKRDELNKAIASGAKTKDEAAAEFDAWWTATVEPQSQQLQQQQQQDIADATVKRNQEIRAQQAAEQSAFTTAQGAGRDAVAAAQAQMPYMVGPGFGSAVNQIANAYASGKPAGNLDIGSAVTFDMPNFSQIAEQATAKALAHLSPTAAGIAQQTLPSIPQGVNVAGALNKSQYAPTVTVQPDGTVQVQHQQQQQPFAQSGLPEGSSRGMPPSVLGAPLLPPMAPNEQQIFGNYLPS